MQEGVYQQQRCQDVAEVRGIENTCTMWLHDLATRFAGFDMTKCTNTLTTIACGRDS